MKLGPPTSVRHRPAPVSDGWVRQVAVECGDGPRLAVRRRPLHRGRARVPSPLKPLSRARGPATGARFGRNLARTVDWRVTPARVRGTTGSGPLVGPGWRDRSCFGLAGLLKSILVE